VGDANALKQAGYYRNGDWNEFTIRRMATLIHLVNGYQTVEMIDNDAKSAMREGIPRPADPCRAAHGSFEFKDIWLKVLDATGFSVGSLMTRGKPAGSPLRTAKVNVCYRDENKTQRRNVQRQLSTLMFMWELVVNVGGWKLPFMNIRFNRAIQGPLYFSKRQPDGSAPRPV